MDKETCTDIATRVGLSLPESVVTDHLYDPTLPVLVGCDLAKEDAEIMVFAQMHGNTLIILDVREVR